MAPCRVAELIEHGHDGRPFAALDVGGGVIGGARSGASTTPDRARGLFTCQQQERERQLMRPDRWRVFSVTGPALRGDCLRAFGTESGRYVDAGLRAIVAGRRSSAARSGPCAARWPPKQRSEPTRGKPEQGSCRMYIRPPCPQGSVLASRDRAASPTPTMAFRSRTDSLEVTTNPL